MASKLAGLTIKACLESWLRWLDGQQVKLSRVDWSTKPKVRLIIVSLHHEWGENFKWTYLGWAIHRVSQEKGDAVIHRTIDDNGYQISNVNKIHIKTINCLHSACQN